MRPKVAPQLRGRHLGELFDEFVQSGVDILILNEALDKLALRDRQAAELVKLRYFAGLSSQEAADYLGFSARTADRVWAYARSFLLAELQDQ